MVVDDPETTHPLLAVACGETADTREELHDAGYVEDSARGVRLTEDGDRLCADLLRRVNETVAGRHGFAPSLGADAVAHALRLARRLDAVADAYDLDGAMRDVLLCAAYDVDVADCALGEDERQTAEALLRSRGLLTPAGAASDTGAALAQRLAWLLAQVAREPSVPRRDPLDVSALDAPLSRDTTPLASAEETFVTEWAADAPRPTRAPL